MPRPHWITRALLYGGFIAVVVGTIDPLEGSVAILAGFIALAIVARLEHSRRRASLALAVLLVALGVGAMFVLSAYGGVGGSSGHSAWWALTIVPYPIGWIVGLVESIRLAREPRTGI